MNRPLADQTVSFPGFAIVGEVGADDALLVHPQIAIIVLMVVPRGRGTGDDLAARTGDKDASRKGFMAWVFIDHIRVFTFGEFANLFAEPAQLADILRSIWVPEAVAFGIAVNYPARTDGFTQLYLVRRG